MKTLMISIEDLARGNLRILPKYTDQNRRDIVCRPVGISGKRAYVGMFYPQELTGTSWQSDIFSSKCKARLLPQHLEESLLTPNGHRDIVMATATAIFSERNFHTISWENLEEIKIVTPCRLCEKRAADLVTRYGENNFEEPPVLTAQNISFSNIWGHVLSLPVCDKHYKSNHGYMMDDFNI